MRCGEFHGREIVVGAPIVTGGDATHLFEAIEEALDDVASAVDPSAEGEGAFP